MNSTDYTSYHAKASLDNSIEILETVSSNLRRYLETKGRTRTDFLKWVKAQKIKGVPHSRIARWPGMEMEPGRGNVETDTIRAVSLVAAYMGKSPKEVMFSNIPLDSL